MPMDNVVDVDANDDRVEKFMEEETVKVGGQESSLENVIADIQTAHKELDEYKSGSLSLSQTLSEAAKETDDEVLQAILTDMSDGAFGVYLRLHRGDMELLGERNGKHSGFLTE